MWVKSILIITGSIIVLVGIASLYGKYQWQLETDRLRDRLTNGKQAINPKTYDPKGIRLYYKGKVTEIDYEFAT
jgi:hypothetical protein